MLVKQDVRLVLRERPRKKKVQIQRMLACIVQKENMKLLVDVELVRRKTSGEHQMLLSHVMIVRWKVFC